MSADASPTHLSTVQASVVDTPSVVQRVQSGDSSSSNRNTETMNNVEQGLLTNVDGYPMYGTELQLGSINEKDGVDAVGGNTPIYVVSSGTKSISSVVEARAFRQEGSCENVIAVVNPLAGETRVSKYITKGLKSLLGEERVILLDKELFAKPAPLREAICNYAVKFLVDGGEGACDHGDAERHSNPLVDRRGTVIVSGGDGTVSFVMEQLDRVREEMERSCSAAWEGGKAPPKRILVPALGVLAFGTGNDFSRCMGFGGGYSPQGCCGSTCGAHAIENYVQGVLEAPSVPFDRWVVQVVPLTVARLYRQHAYNKAGDIKGFLQELPVVSNAASKEGVCSGKKQQGKGGSNRGAGDDTVVQRWPDALLLDWDGLLDHPECPRYHFINYFSVGFDAYVTHRFTNFRKKHIGFCSKRWRSKLVYGFYSFAAQAKCPNLRKYIRGIRVRDNSSDAQLSASTEVVRDSEAEGTGRVATLALPAGAKTLLFTNVNSYAAGTRPWSKKGKVYRRKGNKSMMDVTQVFVDDRVVEMQAIGGMCQMAMMQMFTCSGATKLAQASDVIFCVGCTPEDIHKQHPTPSAGGRVKSANSSKSGGKSSGEKEDAKMKPLYVQVDGEAVMSLTVPSVIRVRELCRPRVYVHCANQKVLKQAVAANK